MSHLSSFSYAKSGCLCNLLCCQEEGRLAGVRISRDINRINHLFFADDCLFFIKAELGCLSELKRVLGTYEMMAGQQVNFNKSELCGSKNVDGAMCRLFGEFMNMEVVQHHSKYLGLPMVVGQNKIEVFRNIEDKTQMKINNWSSTLLSQVGKEALIKAVIYSIPLYSMSCFRLPKTLCNRMASTAVKFWWSTTSRNKSIHWVRKEIMEKEKIKGGMGFRCSESLNTAMLMKCLWRLLNHPELLVSKIYQTKYYRDGYLLEASARPTNSFAWKSLF